MLIRREERYTPDNLRQDACIFAAPASLCVWDAAVHFSRRGLRTILDLTRSVGRDTFHLAKQGLVRWEGTPRSTDVTGNKSTFAPKED